MQNLKDQLLKAKLVSKKQVRKVEHQERERQKKLGRKGVQEEKEHLRMLGLMPFAHTRHRTSDDDGAMTDRRVSLSLSLSRRLPSAPQARPLASLMARH